MVEASEFNESMRCRLRRRARMGGQRGQLKSSDLELSRMRVGKIGAGFGRKDGFVSV